MPARKSAASEPPASRPNAPDYEIVAENAGDGLLPWTWAVRKLSRSRNYFLSTVRRDRRPHIMPIWGVWVENAFYFSTGKRSVKARNLRANPRCVVCPGDAEEAVILEGVARVVRSRPVLKRFARAYLEKYKWNVSKMNEPVYAVRPRVVFGQIEKTFTKSATRWTFPSTALLLSMFAFTNNASACECVLSGPPCQNYFQVDVVFAGTVQSQSRALEVNPPFRMLRVDFTVSAVYRGIQAPLVSVVTADSSAACGYSFKEGERYRTDDQGRYEIKGLPPGKYEVLALPSAAFVPPLLRRIELRDPRACSLVDWEVRYDGRIRGVVKDFSGRPASGAQVEVMADRMLMPAGIETLRTEADTEGNFEFTQVPPGRYLVGVNLTRRPNSTIVFPTTFHPGTNDIWQATVVQLEGGGRVELAPMTLPPPKR